MAKKKCVSCGEELEPDEKKCTYCETVQPDPAQSGAQTSNPGSATTPTTDQATTKTCHHCKGKGECKSEKAAGVEHSCEYCVKKSGIESEDIFLVVPCAYCGGKGHHDLQPKKLQQGQGKPYQGQKKQYNNNRQGRR